MANLLGGLKSLRMPHQVVMGVMAALVLSLGLLFQGITPAQATGNPYILIYKVDDSVPPLPLGGATFRIVPNPAGACQDNHSSVPWDPANPLFVADFLDVTDNVFHPAGWDEDPAVGVIRIQDLIPNPDRPGEMRPGPCDSGNGVLSYTISEITAPVGYVLDPVAHVTPYVRVLGLDEAKATFVNRKGDTPTPVLGRMTGGGSVFTVESARVTRGFEIHCDLRNPNNIEVNWPGGNNFHMDLLNSAVCTDAPGYEEAPPEAGFDTFDGVGTGKLNNVPGASIKFHFEDHGEPGNTDIATIRIFDQNNVQVLFVSGPLKFGNIQAHKDNP